MFTDSKSLKFIFLFWWIALQWVYSSQFPSPAEDMKGLLFYGGACVFFLIFFQKKKPVISTLTGMLMAYLLISCISLTSGIAWYDGWIEIGRLILWMVAAVLFVQISEADIERLLNVSIISASLIALGTLLEASGITTWKHLPIVLTNMTPIGHVSYYGLFMAGSFLIALYVYFNAECLRRQILGIIGATLTFSALWYTGSRSNIVGLFLAHIVGISMMLIFKKISKYSILKTFFLVLLISISLQFLPGSYRGDSTLHRFVSTAEIIKTPDSKTLDKISSRRWILFVKSLEMIREKPFLGWGVDSYRFVYPEFAHGMDYTINSWIMHPHNEIFHQWATVGLFGLILFVFFWSYLCFNSYQKLKKLNSATQDFSKIILGLSGVVLMLGSWQFDTNYQQPLSRAFMALFVGLLLRSDVTPNDQWLSKLSGSWIKGVVCVAGLLVVTSLASLYYVKQSEISERGGDLEQAFENADFAKLLSPRFFDTNYRYSNLHFRRQNPADSSQTIVQLTHDYPYTAMVLKLAADFEFAHKNYFDSQYYAREALRVDPTLESAKELLKSFEKTQELSK